MPAWYNEWFNKDYLNLYPHRGQDEARLAVDFVIKKLKLKPPATILDVACGAGRHVSEFAHRGFEVVGSDLSKDLLKEASFLLSEENLTASFVEADMRKMPFTPKSFDLLTSFFTSFGYFETDEEHKNLLTHWKSLIKQNGKIAIDYLNKDYIINNLVPETVEEFDDRIITQKRSISEQIPRVEKTITICYKDTNETKTYQESVRLYSELELDKLVSETNLKIFAKFGDFTGVRFSTDSPRLIMFIERASSFAKASDDK